VQSLSYAGVEAERSNGVEA